MHKHNTHAKAHTYAQVLTRTHMHKQAHTGISTHTCISTQICVSVYTYMRRHAHTCTITHSCTYMHIHMHKYVHTYGQVCMYRHAHTCTSTHTHIHRHMHRNTQRYTDTQMHIRSQDPCMRERIFWVHLSKPGLPRSLHYIPDPSIFCQFSYVPLSLIIYSSHLCPSLLCTHASLCAYVNPPLLSLSCQLLFALCLSASESLSGCCNSQRPVYFKLEARKPAIIQRETSYMR